jgi:transcriptional regulator with XRE-family HTH domain
MIYINHIDFYVTWTVKNMQEKFEQSLLVAVMVRAVRGLMGLSQKEFASIVELPLSTITRVESLETDIRLAEYNKVKEVIAAFGIKGDAFAVPFQLEVQADFYWFATFQMLEKMHAKKVKNFLKDGSVRYTANEYRFLESCMHQRLIVESADLSEDLNPEHSPFPCLVLNGKQDLQWFVLPSELRNKQHHNTK